MILSHRCSFPLNSKEKNSHRKGLLIFLDEAVHEKREDVLTYSLISAGYIQRLARKDIDYRYDITNIAFC